MKKLPKNRNPYVLPMILGRKGGPMKDKREKNSLTDEEIILEFEDENVLCQVHNKDRQER